MRRAAGGRERRAAAPEGRSKKQVADGETCSTRKVDKGDRTFLETKECTPKYKDEPVYDDKCDYCVNRWHIARIATAQGKTTANVNLAGLEHHAAGRLRRP